MSKPETRSGKRNTTDTSRKSPPEESLSESDNDTEINQVDSFGDNILEEMPKDLEGLGIFLKKQANIIELDTRKTKNPLLENAIHQIKKVAKQLPKIAHLHLKELRATEASQEHIYRELSDLKTTTQETSNHLQTVITEQISAALEAQLTEVGNKLNEMEELKKSILESIPSPCVSDSEEPQAGISTEEDLREKRSKTRVIPKKNKESKEEEKPPPQEPVHRRTLILRSNRELTKPLSGRQIEQLISRISCPTNQIEKIIPRRDLLVIICRTTQFKELIKMELEANANVRQQLIVTTQKVRLQKMMLPSIPERYTPINILGAISAEYKVEEEEVRILRPYKTKNPGTQDWLIMLPVELAKIILRKGGIRVGYSFSRLRPYTYIERCRRCQSFDHQARFCLEKEICEQCGKDHPSQDCNEPPYCINCASSNYLNRTRYPTKHASSSPACPVYQHLYSQERERLEQVFYGNPPQLASPDYQEPPPNMPPEFNNNQPEPMRFQPPRFGRGKAPPYFEHRR